MEIFDFIFGVETEASATLEAIVGIGSRYFQNRTGFYQFSDKFTMGRFGFGIGR